MDDTEAAGLEAFRLHVETEVVPGVSQRPAWLHHAGERLAVEEIVAEWVEVERVGFRLRASDGSHWLVYYVPELDLWSGTVDAGVGPALTAEGHHARTADPE